MKIQLIHPPVYVNVWALTVLRPALPLGLAYVAAMLRRTGHDVSVIDAVGLAPRQIRPGSRKQIWQLGLTPDEIIDRLAADADVFGITNTWSFSWPIVRTIIRKCKRAWPRKPIVCGGEHFTGLPRFSMEQAPIDFIVLGEGEEGAVDVLDAIDKDMSGARLARIPGIWYREGSGRPTKSTEPRARKQNIDELPWPAWDLFDVKAYDDHRLTAGIHYGMTVPILATRGCPYQCTYCSSPQMWTTRWYARAPKDVVDEIEHWHRTYGADNFPFHDLTAIIKKQWILEFCRELYRRPFHEKIVWQFPSGTRLEVIDDEVAEWMAKVNCKAPGFAPESGSAATRKRIKKMMKEESLIRAVKAAVKHGLNVSAWFVIGFPEDDAGDLRQNVRLARKLALLGIADLALGFFFPIPNTALYHQLEEQGKIRLDDDFLLTPILSDEGKLSEANNYSYHLSAGQLTWWRYRILLNFYLVSYARRPWRIVTTIWNTLVGHETRKMETFLVDMKRKMVLGAKVWRAGRRAQ